MAENATPQQYNFSPSTISGQDYQTIKAEREGLLKKQLAASHEFMYQHYVWSLRAIDVSYERAPKVNIMLERKSRRDEAKKKKQARCQSLLKEELERNGKGGTK